MSRTLAGALGALGSLLLLAFVPQSGAGLLGLPAGRSRVLDPRRELAGGRLLLDLPRGARLQQDERHPASRRRSGALGRRGSARARRGRPRRRRPRGRRGALPRPAPRSLRELDAARPLDAHPRRSLRLEPHHRSRGRRALALDPQRLRRRLPRLELRALARPRGAAEHLARRAALAEDADRARRGDRGRARGSPSPARDGLLGLRRGPLRDAPPLVGRALRERLLSREHRGLPRLRVRRRDPRDTPPSRCRSVTPSPSRPSTGSAPASS